MVGRDSEHAKDFRRVKGARHANVDPANFPVGHGPLLQRPHLAAHVAIRVGRAARGQLQVVAFDQFGRPEKRLQVVLVVQALRAAPGRHDRVVLLDGAQALRVVWVLRLQQGSPEQPVEDVHVAVELQRLQAQQRAQRVNVCEPPVARQYGVVAVGHPHEHARAGLLQFFSDEGPVGLRVPAVCVAGVVVAGAVELAERGVPGAKGSLGIDDVFDVVVSEAKDDLASGPRGFFLKLKDDVDHLELGAGLLAPPDRVVLGRSAVVQDVAEEDNRLRAAGPPDRVLLGDGEWVPAAILGAGVAYAGGDHGIVRHGDAPGQPECF